jgi:Na+-translocating membrane potential-generating system (MpsC)
VRIHKECYGKRPTKAHTHVHGDHVLCVLQGDFDASERTLLAHGRGDAVDAQRLQQSVRERFISIGQLVAVRPGGADTPTPRHAAFGGPIARRRDAPTASLGAGRERASPVLPFPSLTDRKMIPAARVEAL